MMKNDCDDCIHSLNLMMEKYFTTSSNMQPTRIHPIPLSQRLTNRNFEDNKHRLFLCRADISNVSSMITGHVVILMGLWCRYRFDQVPCTQLSAREEIR